MIEVAGEPSFPVVRRLIRSTEARSPECDADLYARLAPELMRFATVLVGPSDAEDLLGSTVAKAIASARWASIENRRAYLYRALANEAHKWRRTSTRRSSRELRIAQRESIDMSQALDPDVFAALKRLTVRQRAVIHLAYWADLTPPQVAEALGTSLRTVERELANARTRLGEILS